MPKKFQISALVLVLILFLVHHSGLAQESEPIVIGQKVKLNSKILNEDRMLWIYCPDTSSASGQRFPVMYLLDGESNFIGATGIVQFLSANDRIPNTIVVGIENTNRMHDLTPLPADTNFAGSGGADTFLEFISRELIPYVDSHYPTAPFRMLVGHSIGGLFALNALLTNPKTFNSYVLISSNLWWGNDAILNRLEAFLTKVPRIRAFIYQTTAQESPRNLASTERLVNLIDTYQVDGLEWKVQYMLSESHSSVVHRSIYDGLEFIFSSWEARGDLTKIGMPGLLRHYNRLSNRYGYKIDPPESSVNSLGYSFLNNGKVEEAISIFKWNVQQYPNSWNVYDSLGEAFAAKGETMQAIVNYERSVALNPKNTAGIEALKKLKAR